MRRISVSAEWMRDQRYRSHFLSRTFSEKLTRENRAGFMRRLPGKAGASHGGPAYGRGKSATSAISSIASS
jgi:hypothetical protein